MQRLKMAIIQEKKITQNEKRKLLALLAEMKSRGLEVPNDIILPKTQFENRWNVDDDGFFINVNDRHYVPTDVQRAFILDGARFSLFRGSRGCVAAETIINGIPIADRKSADYVPTLRGYKYASPGYVKGVDKLYKVTTQSGFSVLATGYHRFLTQRGWLPLNSLECEDLILSDGSQRVDFARETKSSSSDYCSLGSRQYDELYNLLELVSLDILQQLRNTVCDNSAWSYLDLLSIVDFCRLTLFQFLVEHSLGLVSSESIRHLLHTFFQFLCTTIQKDIDQQNYLESPFLLCEISSLSLFLDQVFLEQNQCSVDYALEVALSLPASSQKDTILQYLSTLDVSAKSVHVLDFLSSFRYFLDSQYYSAYKFSLKYLDLGETLYQQGIHFLFPELLQQSYRLADFSLEMGEKQELHSILRLYELEQERHSETMQSALLSSLPLFVSRFDSNRLSEVVQSYYCSPIYNNPNTFFDKVKEIKFDKTGEYYDIEVPFCGNYFANGMLHHNSGKTASGSQKALRKVMQGKSGMVVNPDLENFRLSTWPELRQWIPWQMVIPKQRYRKDDGWDVTRPFTMVFMNGARIYCKGLKDPDSARGPNVNWLWYDEGARDKTGLGWRIANFGVRIGDDTQAWITTTPKGLSHWLYEFFEKKEIPFEVEQAILDIERKTGVKRELVSSYHGTVEQNKSNLDSITYASYVMSAPTGYLRSQEIEGEYANEEGSLGDRSWFDGKVLDTVPDWVVKQVRFWDLAATEKKMVGKKNDPDETIGSLLGVNSERDKFVIEDQVGGYWEWKRIKQMIVETARNDGSEVTVCFEQEPASGGKNQVAELKEVLKTELPGWNVQSLEAKKLGDRVLAANTWFGEASNGQFYIVRGGWNEKFLVQLDVFPNGTHDDRVTSVTGARHWIAPIRKWKKISFATI